MIHETCVVSRFALSGAVVPARAHPAPVGRRNCLKGRDAHVRASVGGTGPDSKEFIVMIVGVR